MPAIADNLRMTRANDKRLKLTQIQRDDIVGRRGESIHALSREYGVSRRLIQFIQYPERHAKNLQDRQARGGSMLYYTTEKHTEIMREHRKYKTQLKEKGLI